MRTVLTGVAAAAGLALAMPSAAATPTLTPPTFAPAICNSVTGAVASPPSYTLPKGPGVKWQVQVNLSPFEGVKPGTYQVNPAQSITVVIDATRGHKLLHEWAHTFPRTMCASINPPPTGPWPR
jgi:hypothetical protein